MSEINPFAAIRDASNPYAAPTTPFAGDFVGNDAAEATRRQYLSHEASVQSVGLLYLLGGVLGSFAGLVMLGALATADKQPGTAVSVALVLFILGIGIAQCFVGFGLRKLRAWTRIPVGILSGIGLLGIPIGTIINGYILYLIFSRKGSMVFSEEYHRVIQQTPHIKYRTSIIVWIFLFLLLAVIGLGLMALLISA